MDEKDNLTSSPNVKKKGQLEISRSSCLREATKGHEFCIYHGGNDGKNGKLEVESSLVWRMSHPNYWS